MGRVTGSGQVAMLSDGSEEQYSVQGICNGGRQLRAQWWECAKVGVESSQYARMHERLVKVVCEQGGVKLDVCPGEYTAGRWERLFVSRCYALAALAVLQLARLQLRASVALKHSRSFRLAKLQENPLLGDRFETLISPLLHSFAHDARVYLGIKTMPAHKLASPTHKNQPLCAPSV